MCLRVVKRLIWQHWAGRELHHGVARELVGQFEGRHTKEPGVGRVGDHVTAAAAQLRIQLCGVVDSKELGDAICVEEREIRCQSEAVERGDSR